MSEALDRIQAALAANAHHADKDTYERIKVGPAVKTVERTAFTEVFAQDVVEVGGGLTDEITAALVQGAVGALVGRPKGSPLLPVHQKTWQLRRLVEQAMERDTAPKE